MHEVLLPCWYGRKKDGTISRCLPSWSSKTNRQRQHKPIMMKDSIGPTWWKMCNSTDLQQIALVIARELADARELAEKTGLQISELDLPSSAESSGPMVSTRRISRCAFHPDHQKQIDRIYHDLWRCIHRIITTPKIMVDSVNNSHDDFRQKSLRDKVISWRMSDERSWIKLKIFIDSKEYSSIQLGAVFDLQGRVFWREDHIFRMFLLSWHGEKFWWEEIPEKTPPQIQTHTY